MTKNENKRVSIPSYTLGEEIVNSITHGIGALLSVLALVLLVIKASKDGSIQVVTTTLYASTLIILYTISCIYHALSSKLVGKKVLRVIDHCNVYLLVYGTIIPLSILGIGGLHGWLFFGVVSFVTTIGIVLSAIFLDKVQIVEVVCHLVNGWGSLFFIRDLLDNLGNTGVVFLILGGIMYTIGAILYGVGSKKRYMHSVFHVFCILGSLFQFLCIYLYLL